MFKQIVTLLLASSASLVTCDSGFAQSKPVPLAELLPTLHRQVIAAEDRLFGVLTSTEPEDIRKARLDTVLHINNLFATQLSSFPLGSSAGGFTWSFQPITGTFTRASDSFGPVFAERALTIGRKKLNVGFNYQHVTFDHLDGKKLADGELVGYTGLPLFLGSEEHPNGVYFEERLALQLTTDTVSLFAIYGVTDRLDVGLAVPINRVSVKATFLSQYGNTVYGTANPTRPESNPDCASYWIGWIQFAADRSLYVPPVIPNGCGLKAEASGTAAGRSRRPSHRNAPTPDRCGRIRETRSRRRDAAGSTRRRPDA